MYKTLLITPEAEDKAKKVFVVDGIFYKKLENWANKKIKSKPTPTNRVIILKSDNTKIGSDYQIVSKEAWEQIKQDFNITRETSCFYVKHPKTGKATVIVDQVILEFTNIDGTSKKKTCEKTWNIEDIKNQICRGNGLDPNSYHFINSDTSKTVNSTLSAEDCKRSKYKLKLVESRQNSSKNANVFDLSKQYAATTKPGHPLVKPYISDRVSHIPIPKKLDKAIKTPILSPKLEKTVNKTEVVHTKPEIIQPKIEQVQEKSLVQHELKPPVEKEVLPSLKELDIGIKSILQSTSSAYPKPVGMNNLGNTCYFNSAVQCLIRVKPLTDFVMSPDFESHINRRNKKGSKGSIALAYRDFIKLMSTGGSAKNPSSLRSAIVSKYRRFANYSQHDSQELLGALLDGLHEDLNQAFTANGNQPEIKVDENTDSWTLHLSKNYSPIVDMFHGEFFSNTECPNCNYISSVHDPFMFMSVPIPTRSFGKVKLYDCLASFEQVDKLDAKNKWKCEKCGEKVCATKRIGIFRCSKILIIHLKRFSGSGYFSSKVDTEVEYPDVLDTTNYVSKGHGAKYQLIGAVFHSGSLGGGHYTSAALDQTTGKWYNFNDSFASPIDISSAHSRSTYIIFYQKI